MARKTEQNIDHEPRHPHGAIRIDGQFASAVRYDMTLEDGRIAAGAITFMSGRNKLATIRLANREQALAALGERNVANIEAGKGRDKDSKPGTATGKLLSAQLAYHETGTRGPGPENVLEAGPARERDAPGPDTGAPMTGDGEQSAQAAKQRRQRQNEQQKSLAGAAGTALGVAAGLAIPGAKGSNAELFPPEPPAPEKDNAQASSRAIPAAVRERYIQVGDQFFFPDKTHAFDDRGDKLATRGENQEVLRSMVAIALAREWHHVTVRGTEAFRRAAWLEASLAGIGVGGYQPSKVEQAHLAKLLDRKERSIERDDDAARTAGQPRAQANKATSDGATAAGAPPSATPGSPRETTPESPATPSANAPRGGAIAGKLLEHGPARYRHDPKKENSYFVTLETARGTQTIWGVDLGRAVPASGVTIGEHITLEKLGSKPVTARERLFDAGGKEIGERPVEANRNAWLVGSLDKARAFATDDRADVVQRYPRLAPAYGTLAAARKFAEKHFPDSQEDQSRFMALARQVVTEKIARGEPVPAPRIRTPRAQEASHDQEPSATQSRNDTGRDRAR